jgi:hypothetical protein
MKGNTLMKFDVVRTQKNDAYCSAVELNEADLKVIQGGQLIDQLSLPIDVVGNTIGLIAVGLDQGNSFNSQNSQRAARTKLISSEEDWD